MSSGWKLVEAVVESSIDLRQDAGKENNFVKKTSKQKRYKHPKSYKDYTSLTGLEKAKILKLVIEEIKYIFSEQNLCLDTFIRSYMDEGGYVPLAIVACYTNVSPFGVPISDLVEAIKQIASDELEVDPVCQTVKVLEKWEMWLMPNIFGGRGLPLYSNQKLLYDMSLYNQFQYPVAAVYEPSIVSSSEVPESDQNEQNIYTYSYAYAIDGANYNSNDAILMPFENEMSEIEYLPEHTEEVTGASGSSKEDTPSKQLSPTAAEFTPASCVNPK